MPDTKQIDIHSLGRLVRADFANVEGPKNLAVVLTTEHGNVAVIMTMEDLAALGTRFRSLAGGMARVGVEDVPAELAAKCSYISNFAVKKFMAEERSEDDNGK